MRTVTKEAETQTTPERQEGELAAINRLSRTPLTQEEVYTFAVRLCDNQTDRDDEHFDRRGLEKLADLFVGKTGIFDHSWSAKDQTARIYRTELVEEPGAVTEAGEPGCYLKAYAYMLRTPENASLIAEIEGGIKKEVSVSCAVSRCVCAICGNDINDRGLCSHVKGRIYEGKRCIVRLEDPTDAFEWSFVAVPAQRSAGVVKAFRPGSSLRQALARLDRDGAWREELRQLEKEAEIGRAYLEGLRKETVRLGLMAETGLSGDTLRAITDKLEGEELEALRASYEKRLHQKSGLPVQLRYDGGDPLGTGDDRAFSICPICNETTGGILTEEHISDTGAIAFFEGNGGGSPEVKECRQWLEAILEDKEPLVKPQQAFVVTQILDNIYKSAKEGEEIHLD